FFAETIDLGEESLHMQMDLVIDLGSATLDVEFHGFAFRRDGVSVQVTSSSGVDESDLSTVPPHADEAYEIASAIFDAIGDRCAPGSSAGARSARFDSLRSLNDRRTGHRDAPHASTCSARSTTGERVLLD